MASIGVDIYRYEVQPPPQGTEFHFLVWDTDGSYGEAIFRQFYARKADAAMIVGDVSRPSTIDTMVRLSRLYTDTMPGRYVAHVLNKVDLTSNAVPPEIGARMAAETAPLFETSAATGKSARFTAALPFGGPLESVKKYCISEAFVPSCRVNPDLIFGSVSSWLNGTF